MPDAPDTQFADPGEESRMSFGAHLEELRRCLILSLMGIAIGTVLCFFWSQELFVLILRPVYLVLQKYHQEPSLQSLSPPDTFLLWIKISFLCGLLVSTPWVLWQIWQFIASGLYAHERTYVKRFTLPSILLFVLGVSFMFFIVLPIVLNFFAGFNQGFEVPRGEMTWLERQLIGAPTNQIEAADTSGIPIAVLSSDPEKPEPNTFWFNQQRGQLKLYAPDGQMYQVQMRPTEHMTAITNQYSIDFYVSFILQLSLAFGIAFQVPIVVVFLILSGIVPLETVVRSRRYVIMAVVILAAVLTPPDVVSQVLLAIPMLILFELGLWISKKVLANKAIPDGH